MNSFDCKGFAVLTSAFGSREIFYITREDLVPTLKNKKNYIRIEKDLENNILTDFFTTINRSNDNNGTGYEIWKTNNFRFVLTKFQDDWLYRRVELIN